MARGRKPIDRTAVAAAPEGLSFKEQLRAFLEGGAMDCLINVGVIKAATVTAQVSDVMIARAYISIKESRSYLGLPFSDEGGRQLTVAGLEEFCPVYLGRSYSRCKQLAANYHLLGEDLYQAAEEVGWRQLDYAAMKALPQDQQAQVKEVLASEDKERALEVLAELLAKNAAARAAADARAETSEQALKDAQEVHRRLMADKSQRNEQLLEANEKLALQLQRREQLERSDPDARLKALTGELSGMAAKLAFDIRNNLGRAIQTVREVGEEHGIAVDDACAAALGMVRRALADTEGDLGVSLSVRYPAPIYPDKEIRTPDLGQVYGESDHERVTREFAEAAACAAADDARVSAREALEWMRSEGYSEAEQRNTIAWQTLYGADAAPADEVTAGAAPGKGGLRVVGGGRGE